MREATDLPVAVGFGISTPEQAADVAHLACTGVEETAKFVTQLRAAV